MKYCEDCKHYRWPAFCEGPHLKSTTRRSGGTAYAEPERVAGKPCGPDAKLFEQKRSILKRAWWAWKSKEVSP